MAKAKDAVVKAENTKVKGKVAAANDDFLDGFDGEGTEDIGAGDVAQNFLKIAQSNSPELDDGDNDGSDDAVIKGLKAGMFFSSATKRVYGKKVRLVVLKYELVWNIWAPREQGGGLVGRVPVGSVSTMPGDKGKLYDQNGNNVVETQNFYVMVADHLQDGIMLFPLASTMLKHGRKWNSLIINQRTPNGAKQAPIFQQIWDMATVKNTNAAGSWYNIGDKNITAITTDETINRDMWEEAIQENYEMVKLLPPIGGHQVGQAALPAGHGNPALDNV